MKIVSIIARLLLGALFVFSGANHLFNFFKGTIPPGPVADYMNVMMSSGYMYVIGFMQILPGLMLLANRYVPLSLILLGAMIFNIDAINVLIVRGAPGFATASIITLLWALVYWHERASFHPLLKSRPEA